MAPRIVTIGLLALTTALGVVGMSLGINALVKDMHDKDKVTKAAPPGVTVNIDDSDVLAAGAVVTVGCGLLALASFLSLLLLVFRKSARTALQASVIGFLTIWVLASAIGTLVIARTKSAKVEAFLAGTKLPDVLVRAAEKAAGASRVYWDHDYLIPASIVPFIVFFSGLLSTIALFSTRSDDAAPMMREKNRDVDSA